MSSLANKTPAVTFGDLMQISNLNEGVDGTLRPISDGKGEDSALSLSTDAAKVTGDFEVTGNILVNGLVNGGSGNDLNYVLELLVPTNIVTVNHNLGKKPAVTLTDALGIEICADVVHINDNSLQIELSESVLFNVHIN